MVHKSAEAFYRALLNTGEIIPVDQVIETFTAVFDRETKNPELRLTMKEGETVGSLRDQGIELLRLFHTEIRPQRIAAVEFPFSVTIPDVLNGGGDLPIRLIGYLDLVERDQLNTYLVGELKTSNQKFSSVRLARRGVLQTGKDRRDDPVDGQGVGHVRKRSPKSPGLNSWGFSFLAGKEADRWISSASYSS